VLKEYEQEVKEHKIKHVKDLPSKNFDVNCSSITKYVVMLCAILLSLIHAVRGPEIRL